ncbi:hypothetical protein E0485_11915 [Paenibacillus albiflavus]|uniref:Uncharacterized protein n=1 Tax=Paenibacillus albiflavus TaxID=2545760 RepID=A0A4R4EDP8_9BACL|nr:hypothetical protein [Paenibacillus albiflavus]TCZ77160.1 hypothetical protein E0485_11915 [Paenibacillus albiflavus]
MSDAQIKKTLLQGEEFILIKKANLQLEEKQVAAKIRIPNSWNTGEVPVGLLIEAIGQATELLIRHCYPIKGMLYLAQLKNVKIHSALISTEYFDDMSIQSEIVEKVQGNILSRGKMSIGEIYLYELTMNHYMVEEDKNGADARNDFEKM